VSTVGGIFEESILSLGVMGGGQEIKSWRADPTV